MALNKSPVNRLREIRSRSPFARSQLIPVSHSLAVAAQPVIPALRHITFVLYHNLTFFGFNVFPFISVLDNITLGLDTWCYALESKRLRSGIGTLFYPLSVLAEKQAKQISGNIVIKTILH
jgi:hypothetical protein